MRLGSVTRPTADADTVARSQAELLDRLVADEVATIVSGGEVEVPTGDSAIEVDVMDLADDPLPGDEADRAKCASGGELAGGDGAGSDQGERSVGALSGHAQVSEGDGDDGPDDLQVLHRAAQQGEQREWQGSDLLHAPADGGVLVGLVVGQLAGVVD